jgi:L-lysine 2,3-aminomutase
MGNLCLAQHASTVTPCAHVALVLHLANCRVMRPYYLFVSWLVQGHRAHLRVARQVRGD